MKLWQTLKSWWSALTTYFLAQDVPTFTKSVAAGVRLLSTKPLLTLLRLVATLPDRLLILLTMIALSLLGASITWMI